MKIRNGFVSNSSSSSFLISGYRFTFEELLNICKKHNVNIDEDEQEISELLESLIHNSNIFTDDERKELIYNCFIEDGLATIGVGFQVFDDLPDIIQFDIQDLFDREYSATMLKEKLDLEDDPVYYIGISPPP